MYTKSYPPISAKSSSADLALTPLKLVVMLGPAKLSEYGLGINSVLDVRGSTRGGERV